MQTLVVETPKSSEASVERPFFLSKSRKNTDDTRALTLFLTAIVPQRGGAGRSSVTVKRARAVLLTVYKLLLRYCHQPILIQLITELLISKQKKNKLCEHYLRMRT